MADFVYPTYAEIMGKGPAFTPPPRPQEAGLIPLKAKCEIQYNQNEVVRGSVMKDGHRSVRPNAVFIPVTADERRELLMGEYPPAVEPTAAEIAALIGVTPPSAGVIPGITATSFPLAMTTHYHPHSQASAVTKSAGRVTACPDLRGLATLSGLGADGTTVVGPLEITDGLGRKAWNFNGTVDGGAGSTPVYATISNALAGMGNRAYFALAVVRVHHQRSTANILMPRFATYSSDASNTPANGVFGMLKQVAPTTGGAFVAGPAPIATTNAADAYKAIPGTGYQVVAIASRGTANGGIRVYVNNLTCDIAQATTAVTGYLGAFIGAAAGPANTGNATTGVNNCFDLTELAILVGSEVTNAQADACVAAAVYNWGFVNHDTHLVIDGDSQFDGVPTALGANDPTVNPGYSGGIGTQLTNPGAGLIPANVKVISLATSGAQVGSTTVPVTNSGVTRRDAATSVFAYPVPGGAARNKVVAMFGRNDFSESTGQKNSAAFYADYVTLFNQPDVGYLQRGWSCAAVAGVALSSAAVTSNVSPVGENTLQKRQEAVRALIAVEASHTPQPQFLSDTLTNAGQTYAGLMQVVHLYDVSDNGARWFYDALAISDRWSAVPPGPYDNDDTHFVIKGHQLMASGGTTPEYGLGSLL